MGVDTRALIKPNTTETEIVDYLNKKYKDVKSFVKQELDRTIGFINFKDGEDSRSLFYISKSSDTDDIEGLKITGSGFLNLGNYGNSVEILKDLCSHFGGAIDENDCDDEDYYWVNKEKFFEDEKLNFEKELELTFGYENKNKILEIIEKYK